MRSLSWAVVIFPSMSVLRGFFQGFNNMKPLCLESDCGTDYPCYLDAVGDLLHHENWDRRLCDGSCSIDFLPLSSECWLVMGCFSSTFGRRASSRVFFGKQAVHPDINPTAIVIETFKEAVPFIITGSAIQLFQLIDQWTFIRTMEKFTSYSNSQLQVLYAYLSSNPSKITMILIAVALSIAGLGFHS